MGKNVRAINQIEMTEITFQKLKEFCSQPGINVRGVCKEANLSYNYIQNKLSKEELPGKKVLGKLLPAMKKYGF